MYCVAALHLWRDPGGRRSSFLPKLLFSFSINSFHSVRGWDSKIKSLCVLRHRFNFSTIKRPSPHRPLWEDFTCHTSNTYIQRILCIQTVGKRTISAIIWQMINRESCLEHISKTLVDIERLRDSFSDQLYRSLVMITLASCRLLLPVLLK